MVVRSMTGYGQASVDLDDGRLSVELRALNHRFADLRLRLPGELSAHEPWLRRRVLEVVRRGRVEVNVKLELSEAGKPRPSLNLPLLEVVLETTEVLAREHGLAGPRDAAGVLGIPGMFSAVASPTEWGEGQIEALRRVVDQALGALDGERSREGQHLAEELLERQRTMEQVVAKIRERATELPAIVRERLVERLQALAREVELDATRVAQEAALLAERGDVTEEIVRLEGHLGQFRQLLAQPDGDPVGKRLDFLLQEIHRETNTINSKSADLELSRSAMALKAELEKVREQVQNIE